jgi:hypothetical protein
MRSFATGADHAPGSSLSRNVICPERRGVGFSVVNEALLPPAFHNRKSRAQTDTCPN